MPTHVFSARAEYSGAASGTGLVTSESFRHGFSVPSALGGAGAGTNPEELLVAAAATCYAITSIIAAKQRQLPELVIDTECTVETEGGMRITRITHRPHLAQGGSTKDRMLLEEIARIADTACMVSAALRAGGVAVSLEPRPTVS